MIWFKIAYQSLLFFSVTNHCGSLVVKRKKKNWKAFTWSDSVVRMRDEIVRVGRGPQRYDEGPENPRARQGGSHASDNTLQHRRTSEANWWSDPFRRLFDFFFSLSFYFLLSFLIFLSFLPTAGQRYPRGRRGYRLLLLLLPLVERSHGVSVSVGRLEPGEQKNMFR